MSSKRLLGDGLQVNAVDQLFRVTLSQEPLLEAVGGQNVNILLEGIVAGHLAGAAQNLDEFLKSKFSSIAYKLKENWRDQIMKY